MGRVWIWCLAIVAAHLGVWGSPSVGCAQLYFRSPGAGYHLQTNYRGPGARQDTIAIHFRGKGNTDPLVVEGGCLDGRTRRLVVRRLETDGWDWRAVGMDSLSAARSIRVTVRSPGAYELLGVEGTDTARCRIWVMVDDVEFLGVGSENGCDGLRRWANLSLDYSTIRYDRFTYYDLSMNPPREVNELGDGYFTEAEWHPKLGGQEVLYGLEARVKDPPPYERVDYSLRIKTRFGRGFQGESGEIAPVSVLAKLAVVMRPDGDRGDWRAMSAPYKGISPVHLRLGSESKNATGVEWLIRNDARAVRAGARDTLFLERGGPLVPDGVEVPPTLFTAGRYRLGIRAWNEGSGCVDTAWTDLQVDSSMLSAQSIPNVFSPNGDGSNDLFTLIERERNARGIREFQINIFNRNGQEVYHYKGRVEDWPGWNGRRGGRGRVVDPGAYFYVIRARGWDGRQYRGQEYKGVVHLFV